MVSLPTLKGLLFSLAKREWYASLLCASGTLLVSIIMLIPWTHKPDTLDAILQFVAVAPTAASVYFFRRWEKVHGIGEQVRQMMMLQDALGYCPPTLLLTEVMADMPDDLLKSALDVNTGPYYGSKAPVGMVRLAEDIQESAFWTGYQSNWLRKYLGGFLTVLVLLTVLWWYLASSGIIHWAPNTIVARILLTTVAATLNIGVFNWYIRLGDTEREAFRVVRGIDALVPGSDTYSYEVMQKYSEYNALSAQAYLVPDILYQKLWRKRLNFLWDQRRTASVRK